MPDAEPGNEQGNRAGCDRRPVAKGLKQGLTSIDLRIGAEPIVAEQHVREIAMMKILRDRYQIQRQLAKKAGRRTVLAQDLETQQLVAIKLLFFDSEFQWDTLKLFQREAKVLQMLNHPAIPQYLDSFEFKTDESRGFALVQHYIHARSLEEQLKAGRTFSEVEVKQLAIALLDILIYLHQQRPAVVHRDIKPGNILLNDASSAVTVLSSHAPTQPTVPDKSTAGATLPSLYPYLVDFGSVQTLAAQHGGTMTVVGTYGYMPPEQFGGRVWPRSDLYSVGATLIYLVTGNHPAELPQVNLQLQFRETTALSSTFADWLQWMTEPNPEKRPCSALAALAVLRRAPAKLRSERFLRIPLTLTEAIPHHSLALTLWQACWRSTVFGIVGGVLARTGWGVMFGLWNGMVIGMMTHRFPYTIADIRNHCWHADMGLISAAIVVVGILLFAPNYAYGLIVLPPLLWLANSTFMGWYQWRWYKQEANRALAASKAGLNASARSQPKQPTISNRERLQWIGALLKRLESRAPLLPLSALLWHSSLRSAVLGAGGGATFALGCVMLDFALRLSSPQAGSPWLQASAVLLGCTFYGSLMGIFNGLAIAVLIYRFQAVLHSIQPPQWALGILSTVLIALLGSAQSGRINFLDLTFFFCLTILPFVLLANYWVLKKYQRSMEQSDGTEIS